MSRRPRRAGERGVILLFTLGILLTLTMLVGAFLYSVSTSTLGAGGSLTAAQALWVAEAGLQQVYYQLYTDSRFRGSPTSPVTGSIGAGSYSVMVSKRGTAYTLASTGTVSGFSRTVDRTAVVAASAWAPAFDYAIFSNNNSLWLRNTVTIQGSLYSTGAVTVDSGASVTGGLVYAPSVSGAGTYTAAGGPASPVPSFPSFDTSSYDTQIAIADARKTDLTLSGSSNLNLAGGTVYYDKVTIKNNATVTGPGTIVAGGAVSIQDSANIGPGVTLMTKMNLTVQGNAVIQSGGVLYSKTGILKLTNNASVTGSLVVPIGGNRVTLQRYASLTGIIYADLVDLRDNSTVTGSVVGNNYLGGTLINNAHVTFSSAARPSTPPTGLSGGNAAVTPQTDWQEVSS